MPTKRPTPKSARAPARTEMRATINDIARLAQVSKKTVSRVINNSPRLREETRQRILSIIKETGFVPDPHARGLASRRAFLIGLIYDNPNAQYVIDMMQGILDAVRGSGFELVVHPCSREAPGFRDEVRLFVRRQKLFGVVLTSSVSEDDELCRMLEEIDCPFSRVASVALDQAERMVVTHDFEGGLQAARHLADLGHRLVAFISGPDSFRSSHERRRGFEAGLMEAGMSLDEKYTRQGGYIFETGLVSARALLGLRPRPTAIFAANDEMAAGVYQAAHEMGIAIPDALSVIGFDDSPVASKIWPPLTSVRFPIREMGRIAAQKLFSQGGIGDPRRHEFPQVHPVLVIRQSTAQGPK